MHTHLFLKLVAHSWQVRNPPILARPEGFSWTACRIEHLLHLCMVGLLVVLFVPLLLPGLVDPFLLDPAAALGCMSPWHMKLKCLDLVAAFLLGVSSAVCSRQPPTASVLAHLRLLAWSSVHAWLLRLRTGCDFAYASSCFARVRPCALGC